MHFALVRDNYESRVRRTVAMCNKTNIRTYLRTYGVHIKEYNYDKYLNIVKKENVDLILLHIRRLETNRYILVQPRRSNSF